MRILVIGATGTVGSHVVSQLHARGGTVRALSRKPEAASLPPNVDAVRGDLALPETLDGPLDGIDAVFLVWTAPATAIDAALERICRRARRIVYLSAPLKTPHPLFQQPNAGRTQAERIEALIASSGLEWTFLRPGMFAANALRWFAPQTRAGDVVRWPYLDVPTAPIDERDIAAVAVRALCDEGHAGAEYGLTGPQSLSHSDQLEIIGRAIGRTLRIEELTREKARRELPALIDFGAPVPPPAATAVVNILLEAWGAARGHAAWMTSTVGEVTGSPARTFEQWVADHAAAFELLSAGVPDPALR